MDWYEKAANDFIKHLDEDKIGHSKRLLRYIKKAEETYIRFHFDTGMQIRNSLRQLGYTDDKYGNLDNHYLEILKICYKKVGV